MKSYATIKLRFIFALTCFMIALCLFSPTYSSQGAKNGLITCGDVIIPSLFPFCVISLFFFKSGAAALAARLFRRPAAALFHLSGEKFCVLIMSLLGGYPIGERLIRELYDQKRLTLDEARRMGIYCVNSGPAFTVIAVGSGIAGNINAGFLLLGANIFATLILAFLCEIKSEKPKEINIPAPNISLSDAFVESTAQAAGSIFGICGWVVLFSALFGLISSLRLPQFFSRALLYTGEVTTAAAACRGNIILTAAILSFAGLSVHCQIYSVGKECAPNYIRFLAGRFVHAAISALITFSALKADRRAVFTISNGVETVRHNASISTAGAIALVSMCVCLIISVNSREKEFYGGKNQKGVLK